MNHATPDDLPEEVRALGTPTAVFKARRSHTLLYLVLGILTLSCEGLSLIFLLVDLLTGGAVAQLGQVATLVRPGFCSLVWMILGAVMIYRGLQTSGMKVFVFPDGLARVDRQRADIVYWNEAHTVRWDTRARRMEMTIATPVQLVLEREDGPPLIFTESVARLRDLRQVVEERTLPHLLPPALQAFRAGKPLSFGAVGVSRDGLRHPYGTLPWDQFDSAEVVKGHLVIRGRGAWSVKARVPRSQVPNLHVLVALAQQAVGGGPTDERVTRSSD